jgi:hypothetical protein
MDHRNVGGVGKGGGGWRGIEGCVSHTLNMATARQIRGVKYLHSLVWFCFISQKFRRDEGVNG